MTEKATLTVQQQWDRYERWSRRLRLVSDSLMQQLEDEDDNAPDVDRLLYAAASHEWRGKDDVDTSLIVQAAPFRIASKIEFVKTYFRDVSFNGPEFMGHVANFLSCQYPSRCNRCYALWFEQCDETLDDTWRFDCALFVPSIDAIDYFSVHEILPFDSLTIRAPRGLPWGKDQIHAACANIQNDLAQDGLDVEIKARRRGQELLELKFLATGSKEQT